MVVSETSSCQTLLLFMYLMTMLQQKHVYLRQNTREHMTMYCGPMGLT